MSYLPPNRLALALLVILTGRASSGEYVLVIGDSLTKEYQSEFVALYPDSPAAWQARNWIEILDARRNDQFDLGSWAVYPDLRLTGHEFNWAKPGGTVREFRNFLRRTPDAEEEIKASSGGEALWLLSFNWRATFTASVGQADKVVIFFGGNDLALGNSDPWANPEFEGSPKQIDYESIYDGGFGDASSPDRLRESIRSNLKSVIQWFRDSRLGGPDGTTFIPPRFTGPMVLCAVPHVGCTPKVQAEAGTDPVRTAVLTRMIELLNWEMKGFAESKDVGFADIYPITKQILDPGAFRIGGVTFLKEADDDCRPRYLFSGDGFHPNTAAHAKIAQVVADAFLEKYPDMVAGMNRIGDREIITDVLGLPADTGYVEWLMENGVPAGRRGPLDDPDADGFPNALEYAVAGRSPNGQDETAPFTAVREPHPGGVGEVLTITWQQRFAENAYCDLVPQISTALAGWQPLPVENLQVLPDGSHRVQLDLGETEALFFRLAAVVVP